MSHALREFWRLPSLVVARFTLVSYIRSGWILGDIAIVWLLYAAFFLEFGGNVAYFFGTAGQGLSALAILGSIVMTQRAMGARVYLPLSRLISRSAYIRGIVIATGVLRIPLYVMMMILGMGYHTHAPSWGIQGATVTNMLAGAVGLLANCIVISTLVVVFSTPIATRIARIALLAWRIFLRLSSSRGFVFGVCAFFSASSSMRRSCSLRSFSVDNARVSVFGEDI